MIHLISFFYKPDYYYKHKDSLETVINSLKFHIDHLFQNQIDSSSLIIKTNFDFTYKDIIAKPFYYTECKNLFLTKLVAAYEVLQEYPNDFLWQHDHDTYQIKKFDMNELIPLLTHNINMCHWWPGNDRPQGASVFYNGLSDDIKRIYDLTYSHSHLCDERLFMHFMSNHNHSINIRLPYEYNTSITKTSHAKRFSEHPYCLHGNALTVRFDRRLYHYYVNKIINQ